MESPYDLKSIGVDDVLFVHAPQADACKYTFAIPGATQHVWIAKVIKVLKKGTTITDTFEFEVVYGWNDGADITKTIIFDGLDKLDNLELEDVHLFLVCGFDDGFKLTKRNIKDLAKTMNNMEVIEEDGGSE
jgi:hypothetical protein